MISIGDFVEVLDEAISGYVNKIEGSIVFIEDDNGFQFQFESHEVVVVTKNNTIEKAVSHTNINLIKQDKESKPRKSQPKLKPKERQKAKVVVDLHIHQLTDSTKGMTNFDILNLQIDTARHKLEFAIQKRIPKLVFIHGVGEGVLRQELETLFRRYDNITFYDADYKTYGFGATEVKIFQSKIS